MSAAHARTDGSAGRIAALACVFNFPPFDCAGEGRADCLKVWFAQVLEALGIRARQPGFHCRFFAGVD